MLSSKAKVWICCQGHRWAESLWVATLHSPVQRAEQAPMIQHTLIIIIISSQQQSGTHITRARTADSSVYGRWSAAMTGYEYTASICSNAFTFCEPVTLTSIIGSRITDKMGFHLVNFWLPRPFRSRVRSRHATDRHRPSFYNAPDLHEIVLKHPAKSKVNTSVGT